MLILILFLLILASEVHAAQDIGYLWVTSQPKHALVYLDGESVATTPISKLLDVGPGEHKMELFRQGYKLYEEKITIRRGQVLEIDIILAKLDSSANAKSTKRYVEAYLTVRSEPSGADVYLDGKRIGRTPIADYKVEQVEQQDRKLRIAKSGYKPHEETIRWIDISDKIKIHVPVELEPMEQAVDTRPSVKPRSRVKFTVNTHVIILFILLLVMIVILTMRIIIKLRQRIGDS